MTTKNASEVEVPDLHKSGVHACLGLFDVELQLLVAHHQAQAAKWGIDATSGKLRSAPLYEAAVKRMRYLEEVQEAVKAAREQKAEQEAEAA